MTLERLEEIEAKARSLGIHSGGLLGREFLELAHAVRNSLAVQVVRDSTPGDSPDVLRGDRLYRAYREQLAVEGAASDPWENLASRDQIAWGKLGRELARLWRIAR